MQIIENKLNSTYTDYPLSDTYRLEDMLFVDIETTGFNADSSVLYMIGCAYYESGSWIIRQFFAESANDEGIIIGSFASLASSYKVLVHFNGNQFDIPYLCAKCRTYKINEKFSSLEGIDLYKRLSPIVSFIRVPDCRQRTLEEFIGIERNNPSLGKDMIKVYEDYMLTPDTKLRDRLLEHNFDDMSGMIHIMKLLAYSDIISSPQKVVKARTQHCCSYNGDSGTELIMKLRFRMKLPEEISTSQNGCYFKGSGDEGYIKVPLFSGELKYFYANYKDYYYIPKADNAMHKSVSSFIDSSKRRQASASDCYTRKSALFMPVWNAFEGPFFRSEYKSHDNFIELTAKRKTDRVFFSNYALEVLKMISCG